MALFSPSASPSVSVKEVDLTGVVPNVQTSTGAFVGNFNWGPVYETTLISDEAGLVSTFAAPSTTNTVDFHQAAMFLKYSSQLFVVRECDSDAKNALAVNNLTATATRGATSASATNQKLGNLDNYEAATIDSSDGAFIARYPGALGNSLLISICGSDSDAGGATNFNAWTYGNSFDGAPGTSSYVSGLGGKNDEIHIAVVDEDGEISGTAGTVLETYPFLSVASNAKATDGTSNYFKDVLKARSEYVYCGDFHRNDSASLRDFSGSLWNTDAVNGSQDFAADVKFGTGQNEWSFTGGVTSTTLGNDDILRGFDKFEDKDNIEVDFLIAPQRIADADATVVVNDLVGTAASIRKDCIAVASPSRNAVVSVGTTTAVTACNDTYTKGSYLVTDNNFVKVYDKYNDQFIKIPANSSVAGLMAATDLVAANWFSPAGQRRGRLLGITDIVLTPSKIERDVLYKAGINPIANIPGQGIMLFGDKTNESRPSAFDRINVRRLFLGIERAIAIAGRNVMFEFNDEFTRAEFVNIVEPFLREIQGRRGITDFRVVCDSTNNTAAVIDRNEFIASIFIKPARSINFVTLNFVAVRTGVEFEEVVGTV